MENKILEYQPKKYKENDIIQSPLYGEVKLINYNFKNKKWLVEFQNTGFQLYCKPSNVIRGEIKDRLTPTVYGIGMLGYANKIDNEEEYSLWRNMLQRCYYINGEYYNVVKVDVRWHRLDYFIADIKEMKNYDKWKANTKQYDLDKDILQINKPHTERIYSKETCTFATHMENHNAKDHIWANYSKRKTFKVNYPDGKSEIITGIVPWCDANNLNHRRVIEFLKGKYKSSTYKGYTFEYIDNN